MRQNDLDGMFIFSEWPCDPTTDCGGSTRQMGSLGITEPLPLILALSLMAKLQSQTSSRKDKLSSHSSSHQAAPKRVKSLVESSPCSLVLTRL